MPTNVGAPRSPNTMPPQRGWTVCGDLNDDGSSDLGRDLILRAVRLRSHINTILTVPTRLGGSVRGRIQAVTVDQDGIWVTIGGEQYPVAGGLEELCGGGARASR